VSTSTTTSATVNGNGKSTPDGSLPLVGEATRAPLPDRLIAQLRRAGLVRPRAPYPGQVWTPRTEAEHHLLQEAYRLDRVRQLLLADLGRWRSEATRARRGVVAAAAETAKRLHGCPLSTQMLSVVAAAAAGESPEETALRLGLSYEAIKSHRARAVHRLHARNIPHAVAICTARGWVTAGQIEQGLTP
jgi:DNA-binding CsgD family transcriptional regulator